LVSVPHPSEAMTVLCPMRNIACMTLFSNPGARVPGGGGCGLSLNYIIATTSAPTAVR
jgi:hypothetical protein